MHNIIIKKQFLIFNNYKIKSAVGKRGIKLKKKEGDFITPKGSFKILKILYRRDRIKNFSTKIKKIPLKKNMGWCNDPRSKRYNKLISFPFNYSAEKLYKKNNTYDIILVLNYNMNPVRKNKGSAIFIHLTNNYRKTLGCIALKKKDFLILLKLIKSNTKIKIN